MRNRLFLPAIFLLASCANEPETGGYKYPDTRKVDTITDYFGMKVSDPYRWLEDDNSEETKK